MFPEEIHPSDQYHYQVYFENSPEEASAWFEKDVGGIFKAIYAKGDPGELGKPGMTATVTKNGEEVYVFMERTGFKGADNWYLNHAGNAHPRWRNGTMMDVCTCQPVLFIGPNYDPIKDIAITTIEDAQKKYRTNLREVYLDGHALWVRSSILCVVKKEEERSSNSKPSGLSTGGYWSLAYIGET
ncbi:epoxide hydrolase [Seiridium cupressi]